MSVVHSSRPASVDEIAAEMDRRGAVIEKLEAALAAKDAALSCQSLSLSEAREDVERLRRRLDRLTDCTEMVMVNGAGFAAPKPVAQKLADLLVKLDQARDLGVAYSADAKSAEGALITIRRRAIFGPGLSTSDLLDMTAGVAGVSRWDRPCRHAPTYDAGLCCGHPDDCTFISPAASREDTP